MLKLKGLYDVSTSYNVNDVVVMEDGDAYKLRFPCPAGIPPVNDTKYWARLSPELSACAQMIVGCMVPVEAVAEPVAKPEPVKKTSTRKKKEAAAE